MSTLRVPPRRVPGYPYLAGDSVRGPRHLRAGLPNEDSLGWRLHASAGTAAGGVRPGSSPGPGPARGAFLALAAVADGHGSRHCPRSADGSRMAVEAVLELSRRPDPPPESVGPVELIADVVATWLEAVDTDLARRPLQDYEVDAVASAGARADQRLAYGSTLLMCAVTADHLLLAQVGDGEVAVVDAGGRSALPLGANPDRAAGTTDSLCIPGAERRARCAVVPRMGPLLVILASDGCSGAYPDQGAFLSAGADLVARALEIGVEAASAELPEWLALTARRSGDDATGVLVWA